MLTLICGFPGAGKTTYSKQFENICPVLHFDNIRIEYLVKEKVQAISGDVVVEGLYISDIDRRELREAYQGTYTKCIYLDTSPEIRKQRLGWPIMMGDFITPTYNEGWDEIIIIKNNETIIHLNKNE